MNGLFSRRSFAVLSMLAVVSACGPMGQQQQESQQPSTQQPSSNANPPPQPEPTPVTTKGAISIHNGYEYSLWYIYLSSTSDSDWGPDQLRSSTILPGARFTITDIPAGRYDMKAVARDGAVAYVWDFRVVAGQTLNINID